MRIIFTFFALCLFEIFVYAGRPGNSITFFIENKGQILSTNGNSNKEVVFLLPTKNGLNVQFKKRGLAFDTYQRCDEDDSFLFHRLEVEFLEMNPRSALRARKKSNENRNVIRDGKKFEDIGLFGEIVYENIYDNIDIVARSENHHLKYDFVLKENSDVDNIRMAYTGFDSYEIDSEEITFHLSGKTIKERIPRSWLLDTDESIKVEYKIIEESEGRLVLGFVICDSNVKGEPMVIDPEVVPEWSTYHGDSLYDTANDIVTDSLGFIFIAGTTESVEMIASEGAFQTIYAGGGSDAYLTRMNQHGLRHWSTYFGGDGDDEGLGVCIDRYHRIYMVGRTNSSDSTASANAQQPAPGGGNDAFIAAFNRFGTLLWDTYLGGSNDDNLCDCFAFPNGKLIALGTTESPELFTNHGIISTGNYDGAKEIFLAAFNDEGSLTHGSFIGGEGDDEATALDISPLGHLIAAGNTTTSSGLASPGAYSQNLQGPKDGIVFQLDTLFSPIWSSYFGGEGSDYITSIAVEDEGEFFYIGGYTDGEIDLVNDSISAQTDSGGLEDGFIARLGYDGYSEWFTYSGGPENDRIKALDLDMDSSLFAVGITTSATNIVFYEEDSISSEYSGGIDSYLARYEINGERAYSTYLGGEGNDAAQGLAVFGRTAYFIVGATNSEGNMVLTSEQQPVAHQSEFAGGGADAFFARFTGDEFTNPCINCGDGDGGGQGGGPLVICRGDSTFLSVGGGLCDGGEWIWYEDSCGVTDAFIGDGWGIWVSPDSTTTYYVRGENINRVSSCAGVTVFIEEPITVNASVSDSICAGGLIEFQAEGALTYEWSGPDTLTFTGANPVIDSAWTYHLGWYFVTGTGQACSAIDSVLVETIFPAPYIEADIFDPTCVGLSDGSITIESLDSTISSFEWLDVQSATLFRDSLTDGFYPFFAENIYGCTTSSGWYLNEPVNPIDSISTWPDTCGQGLGTAMVFLSTGWMQDFTLAWSTGLDSNIVNPSNFTEGTYSLQVSNAYGCTFGDSFSIGNYGEFITEISTDSIFLEFDASATVEVINFPEQDDPTYVWTPGEGLSCADCSSPVVDPVASTWYFLEVSSELGCSAFDSLFVDRELPPPTTFIPTIFSPNNDGLNDELCVMGNRILEVDFAIYNRWGEEVFATRQLESCWDGTFNGEPLTGSLIYTLKAVLEEGKTIEESGNIQVLR